MWHFGGVSRSECVICEEGVAMAIALDATGTAATSATSPITWSHTIGAGSNTFLVVGVTVNSSTQSTVTAVTFNSVSMTNMKSLQGTSGTLTDEVSLWGLAAPASGAHTVSVTATLGTLPDLAGVSVSYSGVNQSVTPDATGSGQTTTTTPGAFTWNTTTVTDNDWVVAVGNYVSNGATQTTLTATQTSRGTQNMSINLTGVMRMEDTNAAVTPPAVQSMGFTSGGGTGRTIALLSTVSVALAPFVASASSTSSTMLMMGV